MSRILAVLALLGVTLLLPSPAQAATTLTNTGFETVNLSGWSTTGTAAADFHEAGGHSGSYRLSHWSSSAYTVETWQFLSGIVNGTYTLRAWVRAGTASQSWISLKNCGGAERRTYVPVSGDWLRIAVTQTVTNSQCTISLNSSAAAGGWANFDDVSFASGSATLSIKGADVSSLPKSEAFGGRYFTAAGVRGDALTILRDNGVNYARLKVWVNPADGYNNKARVLAMATRAKALGLGLLIDFHYSDSWADPGKQYKPAAWTSLSFANLRTAVYNHTFDVLNALKSQGTTADMVQVGNEINDGMLWEDGRSSRFAQLAQLIRSGYDAVKAVSSSTKVVLHLANGGDNGLYRWWFDSAAANGVLYDVIGVSYYPYWHGTFAAFQTNIDDIATRYGKPVLLAETAYPFTPGSDDAFGNMVNSATPVTGYPSSPAGQSAMLRDIMSLVQAIPNARGLGAIYWEPTWTAVPGNGWDPTNPSSGNEWENQALFDFNDRALPALTQFTHQ
ncbi:glycosyl hydrolase 53 family protein [Acrocarpospora macrocephala]|uniref:Arabinogalactan endo-beta-1,4-galactanase n=1 Tax=Acrocarpospora macrocephala TaxID=150177 RepID=A0A5M3X4G0_9ACTN|nr:glycosyl hydrolase 53 family protein [Acrocarpospora macrocephala]GES15990.1 arabinogalactan endo-beta-1,4-galactanase [Acrocarpospora macrocephala]